MVFQKRGNSTLEAGEASVNASDFSIHERSVLSTVSSHFLG